MKKYGAMMASLVLACGMTAPVKANVCTVQPIAVNGCSTQQAILFDPGLVSAFNGVFASACNKHDICYSQIGSDRGTCDSDFRGNMRASCDSKFNRWLNPGGWQACRTGAEVYYQGVSSYGENFYWTAQSQTVPKANAVHNEVEAERCGMSAELSGLYSDNAMGYVRQAFTSRTGRQPSTFEMFRAINYSNPLAGIAAWRIAVDGYAQSRVGRTPPTLNTSWNDNGQEIMINATAQPAQSVVRLNVNGVSYGAAPQSFFAPPLMYVDETYYFRGFALAYAPANGERELKVIDISVFRRGNCNPMCVQPMRSLGR